MMGSASKIRAFINIAIGRTYKEFTKNGFTGKEKAFEDISSDITYLYNEHSKRYKMQLVNPLDELDKHRQAACITATILDAQALIPSSEKEAAAMYYYPNELFAAFSSFSHIHHVIAKCITTNPKNMLSIKDFVRSYQPQFPATKDDDGDYLVALLRTLRCEWERSQVNKEKNNRDGQEAVYIGSYNYASLSNIYFFYDLYISKQIKKDLSRMYDANSIVSNNAIQAVPAC